MKGFKFHGFFLRGIFFRKYVKFARRENKKGSRLIGTFNKKKLTQYLHQTMLLFKEVHFCSMFENNHKKVLGELIEKRPWRI